MLAVGHMFEAVVAVAGPHPWQQAPAVGGASERLAANMTMQPIVSTIERAAALLKLDQAQLAAAVAAAEVPPWPGKHADGSTVYRWRELCLVARELGAKVRVPPAPGSWHQRRLANQRDARQRARNRKQQQP